MTLRPTTLVAVIVLLAATADARAQSLENGAVSPAAPLTPIPAASPSGGPASTGAPLTLPLPAARAVTLAPARQAVDSAPAKPARVPLAKRWWFWAGLGAATVGVVLAAIFLGPRDAYNGNASPGTVEVF